MFEIKINVPVEKRYVFRYFLEPELITTWLCEDAIINPVVQGAYELFWDLEDRNHNSTIGCRIKGISEDYIAFDWKGPASYEAFMNEKPLTHVVIMFHEKGFHTQITLLHMGWGEDEAWQEAEEYFEKAWQNALNHLKNLL